MAEVSTPRFPGAVRVFAMAGAGVMVVFFVVALLCDAPCDYGEGDTATWVWLLRHGRAIYGPSAAQGFTMVRTNYPPLHLWLVALLSPSDGAILRVGRLVSLASFALTVGLVGLTVFRATRSKRTAVLASLFLTGTFRAAFWAAICRADALALALGTVGVTLAALRTRRWPALSALAFACALLTKQNLVVFPIGTVLWALTSRRERWSGVLLGALTAALVAGGLLGMHLWGPIVSGSVASFRWTNLVRHLLTSVAPSALAIFLALPLALGRGSLPLEAREVLGPWKVVFWVGLAWILTLGRTGADYNYLLELLTTLAILAPVAVAYGASERVFLAQLVIAAVESTVWVFGVSVFVAGPRSAEVKLARKALDGVDEPILSEQTYFAIAAGKAPVVIPFLATQQAAQGRWQAAPLLEAAGRGELQRVLLGFPIEAGPEDHLAWHSERFPPGLLAIIASRYELRAHTESLWVYSPRPPDTELSGAVLRGSP